MADVPYYALPLGSSLSGYRVTKVLGAGSFGVVYQVEDTNLHRPWAIKEYFPCEYADRHPGTQAVVPRPDCESIFEMVKGKFSEEAQALAELVRSSRHPCIVEVISYFEANGTAYIVMQLESGRSLGDLLKEKHALEQDELADIFEPLLEGLALAHRNNIWHRDIKPSNILIRPDGTPVLIDFGAARRERGQKETAFILLTYDYAAPEQQVTGENENLGWTGPWTDVYSMAATMYVAMTGESAPRPGATLPQPARGRYIKSYVATVEKALALHPKRRPQDAMTMLSMLQGGTEVSAVRTRRIGGSSRRVPQYRPNQRPGRRPPLLRLFAALLALGIAGGGLYWYQDAGRPPLWPSGLLGLAPMAAPPTPVPPTPTPVEPAATATPIPATPIHAAPVATEPSPPRYLPGMSSLEGGCFTPLRQDAEPAASEVCVGPFDIATREISVRELRYFAEDSGYRTLAERGLPERGCFSFEARTAERDWQHHAGHSWRSPGFFQDDDHPAVCIALADALAYADWLSKRTGRGFRLPTETEWEYAARAGTDSEFPWGDALEPGRARFAGGPCGGPAAPAAGALTCGTGSFPANPWGLYDLQGNASEWTCSPFDPQSPIASTCIDPQGLASGTLAVVKGGSWNDGEQFLRPSARDPQPVTARTSYLGFRVVADPVP